MKVSLEHSLDISGISNNNTFMGSFNESTSNQNTKRKMKQVVLKRKRNPEDDKPNLRGKGSPPVVINDLDLDYNKMKTRTFNIGSSTMTPVTG